MPDSTCTAEGCERKVYFRGKCHGHYVRVGLRRAGVCTIDGCATVAVAQKLCDKHYTRLRRHGDPKLTLRAPRDAGLAQRLEFTGWSEVVRRPELGACWEWSGGRYETNYGQVSVGDNRSKPAHRIAHLAWIGPLGEGQDVCHRCDNPPCVNPAHLFAGTRKENMEDCASKDRNLFGERVPWRKLGEDDVRSIREAYATSKFSQRELAAAYGVSQSSVSYIVRGKNWARVP